MRKFQSLLLHIWSCRDLASTLNVLFSISFPSLVPVRIESGLLLEAASDSAYTNLGIQRGADGISEAVFDNLSLHICPSTQEA